jgi:CubicO group peptidase (beta-lactamase class C family)
MIGFRSPRRALRLGLAATLALLTLPTAARAQPVYERADALVQAAFDEDGVGGLSIGIVSGGKLTHARAFGFADMERRIPATTDHVYRIGSVTKQFTALALLKLADSGTLRLTDPVERYVPEIERIRDRFPGAPPPTLLQLATMTSGLAREPDDLPLYLVGPASDWMEVLLDALPRVRFDFPPDTTYQYSNVGYAILGAALERASGRGYMDYVREEILEPLGMKDTDFVPRAGFEKRIASGYDIENGTIDAETPAWEHLGRGYKVPNGALYSTVPDLARFLALELGHGPASVLSGKRLEENLGRVSSADGSLTSGYGIGFAVVRRGELVIHGHGGSVAGYRAGVYFDRASDTGVVVLRNVTGGKLDVTELSYRILELVAGGLH